ncbi:MAG: hypothetical protein ACOH16_07650 [Propionibacteriaceae bacterium]
MDGPGTRVRAVANLLNGSTLVGLAVALAGRARVTRGPRGLWYAEGYALHFPIAGAFTVGNVIVTPRTIDEIGQRVAAHEERHTWQYMVCGTMFMPLYVTAMGWSWIRTGDRAARNVFERSAGLADGGYRDVRIRSWSEILRPGSSGPADVT